MTDAPPLFDLRGGTPFGADPAAPLAERYAYPDGLRAPWVRANMVASLDGGATDDGKSGGLGGPNDRAVFAVLRELADVVVVGASTVRAEGYGGVSFGPAGLARRAARGQAADVPIAVITGHADLDPDSALFTDTRVPPMIITTGATAPVARNRFGAAAEVVDASGADGSLQLSRMLDVFAERGLHRVLAEGGPGVLGGLIADGLLDELCLTVSPVLVSGGSGRIVAGRDAVHDGMRCGHVLGDDAGYLYLRYLRDR